MENLTSFDRSILSADTIPLHAASIGIVLTPDKIHNLVTGTGIMGGDVERTGGKRSHSAFGTRFFPDEAFFIPHT